MKKIAIVVALFAVGCGATGKYTDSGPCAGFHVNPQACELAHSNAAAIAAVHVGQTTSEVLAAMGHPPERRDETPEKQSWSYLTDYDSEMMTTIDFQGGKVIALRQTKQ